LGCRRDKLEFVAMLVLVGSWLIDSFVRLPLLLRTLHLAEIGDIGFALEEFVVTRRGDRDVNVLRILPNYNKFLKSETNVANLGKVKSSKKQRQTNKTGEYFFCCLL
jgi:hypothetical protein